MLRRSCGSSGFELRASNKTNVLLSNSRHYKQSWQAKGGSFQKEKTTIGSGCATHATFALFIFPNAWVTNAACVASPIESFVFSVLFYWNLCFLCIKISTFLVLSYWNLLCLLCTFCMGSRTFSALFYWNLYSLCTFLLKSLFCALPIEISNLSVLV